MRRSLPALSLVIAGAWALPEDGAAVAPPTASIPARLQAEDFDSGGEGAGYHDTTPANLGGVYRPAEGVDIGNSFPDDGTPEVGWIVAGEWLQYTIQAAASGDYVLRLRLAQYLPGGRFHVELDGAAATPLLAAPDTGMYRHWVTLPAAMLRLTAGAHTLRLVFDQDGLVGGVMNLNWLELTPRGASVPGRIQAEDFDAGEGIGYHDSTPGNAGDLYRRGESVDITDTFPDDDYSPAVDGIPAGEWLRYTVQAARSGTYAVRLRLSQYGEGGAFHVELDGADITGAVAVPHTTSYANWITLPAGAANLSAGQHTLRVVFDQNGTNGGVMNLNWLELVPESPVVVENRQAGSTGWLDQADLGGTNDITYADSPIKGYASATSVERGEQLTFYVHSDAPGTTVTLQVFRMGYYGGAHGRLMTTAQFAAGPQPACGSGADGVIECIWNESYTLAVPAAWTSGVYLAKLTAPAATPSGIAGNYVSFVVRDDARAAEFLYLHPVSTYQAYNNYPSPDCFFVRDGTTRSLYDFNSADYVRAARVSFRRPHCGNGAGGGAGGGAGVEVLDHELNLIAFLERQGFDVAYTTSIDLHRASPAQLRRHRGLLSASHDEYWSAAMRDNAEEARDRGVGIAFFGSNAAYWQVRFEAGEQTMICYKEGDPNLYPVLRTHLFRQVGRPEQWLMGIQYYDGCCARVDYYWPLQNLAAESWAFAASPIPIAPDTEVWLTVGHEIDSFESHREPGVTDGLPVFVFDGGATAAANPARIDPARLQTLATSSFYAIGGDPPGPVDPQLFQNSSLYQAPSGAWVFASGTLGWALNLADVGRYYQQNGILQNATSNILYRFLADEGDRASANLAVGATVIAGSSYEGGWWSTANVIDGRRNSAFGTSMGYSSEPGWDFNHQEWVGLHLPAIRTFSRVILYPRNDAGYVGEGFPIDFQIQVWDGSTWLDRAVINGYPQPGGTGQSFTFAPATTDRIRIFATGLRPLVGDYYLQFAEIELPGQDSDGDDWADHLDNCPTLWNADQLDTNADGTGDACDTSSFHRGDSNSSGATNISDGITIFGFLFLGSPSVLSCRESADANNDGKVDISDGIYLLAWLFLGGPSPAPPGAAPAPCGFDPDPAGSRGDLGCESYGFCP